MGMFQGLRDEFDIDESMSELAELTLAAEAEVVEIIIQNKSKIEVATYIGSGKVDEVRLAVESHDADIVIFNASRLRIWAPDSSSLKMTISAS
ncbi:MAG TPA: hypothetical protein DCS67_11805, partial [Clostridiales bacterium UBA8960]|nr:hypothetical protein [Clostridiales bacterium UBA8960]